MTEKCETCPFWDNSTQKQGAEPDTTGLCRINPPVADERDGAARWPFTEDTDWCSDHPKNRTIITIRCINKDIGCIKDTECRRAGECLYGEIEF